MRSRPEEGSGLAEADALADLRYVDVGGRWYYAVKRGLDAVCALLGLAVLLLPLLLVALLIWVDDPGPVLFRQHRVGLNGRRFRIYKFRSMRMSAPKYLSAAEMEAQQQYLTRVGRVLRRLSIDELPQLLNVLLGDMSLVGPRPLISDEQEVHRLRERFGVYGVRPGLTGLAQINGRDRVSPEEKVRWDVRYLERFGLWTDVKILLATVPEVLCGHGTENGKE
ncbi:MAG: sugar transferase [Clostridia bacterium]|nr:sugar transferase [Clostridia bacterium]